VAPVNTVAVIGAGAVGRSIAPIVALGGYHTILEDLLPGALRKAEGEIRSSLNRAVQMSRVSTSAAGEALGRLHYAASIEEAARQADVVIEAVPDELESKVEIFTLLDKICRPHTILVCISAELSVSEIAGVTYRPQKCVGIRFQKFVLETHCLEIVQARETDEDTMATAIEMGKRMGKEVTISKESFA
jgi:3-hydroxybutyryl-CoA dehydrogenase